MSSGKSKGAALLVDALLTMVGGPALPLSKAIIDQALQAGKTQKKNGSQLPEVVQETQRIENEMQRLEAQAKVAQEMAIAHRIQTASEVQIEEFYEYGGEGKAGFSSDDKGLTLGVSGAGRRISKRVYKFTGSIFPLNPEDLKTKLDTFQRTDEPL